MTLTCLMLAAAIYDGDTLRCQGHRVRLAGLDAPELAQVCSDQPCGIMARDALRGLLAGKQVTCSADHKDRYGRDIGTCWIEMMDVNAWMVCQGWAIAAYGHQYDRQQAKAQIHHRGIWTMEFENPALWRKEHR